MRNSKLLWVLLGVAIAACGDDGAGGEVETGAKDDTGGGGVEDDIAVQDATADGADDSIDAGSDAETDAGEDSGPVDAGGDVAADVETDGAADTNGDASVDAPDDAAAEDADAGAFDAQTDTSVSDAADGSTEDVGPVVCNYLDLEIYVIDCAGGPQYLREFVDVDGNPAEACPPYWVPGDSALEYGSAEEAMAADNCALDCLRGASMSVSALRCDRRMGWIEFVDAEGNCESLLEFAEGLYPSVEAWCAGQGTCLTPPVLGDVCGEGPPE